MKIVTVVSTTRCRRSIMSVGDRLSQSGRVLSLNNLCVRSWKMGCIDRDTWIETHYTMRDPDFFI